MDFITILKAIITLSIIIIFYKTYRFYFNNKRQARAMSGAAKLTPHSKKGDYVQFQGTLALPQTQTPYNKQNCAYWGVVVRAEFQTKAKKPAKGMTTHKPIIFKDSADAMPLLVADDNHLVQLGFTNNIDAIVNLNSKETKTSKPPSAEVAKLAKPKYKKYLIKESWLPQYTLMALWGTIESINKNCITLAGNKKNQKPAVAFHGDASELLESFSSNTSGSLLLAVGLILTAVSIWSWLPTMLDDFWTGIVSVISLIILIMIKHLVTKNPFK